MPLRHGKHYYSWGQSNTRYRYSNEAERKKAKQKAIIQGYAIEKSQQRRGKKNLLAKSKSTGRKTHLRGVGASKRTGSRSTRKSGSKNNRRANSRFGSKSTRKSGSKSTRKSGSKSTRKSGSKSTRKSGSKSTRKSRK